MSSTQTTLPAISYPLSFQSTGASLPSCFTRRPLFSIACSLFSENTRVGVPQQISPVESTTSSLFFPPLFARQLPQLSILPFVRVSAPPRQSIYCPFVFILLQIPFPGNLFFSHPYKTPGGARRGDCSDVTCCVSRKGLRHGVRRRGLTFLLRLLRGA